MQWFFKLRVTTRLVLSFLIVAMVGAAIGSLGIFHMGRISTATEDLYNKDMRVLKGVQDANVHLLYASRAQVGLLAASTLGERNAEKKNVQAALDALQASMAEIKPLLEPMPRVRPCTSNMRANFQASRQTWTLLWCCCQSSPWIPPNMKTG